MACVWPDSVYKFTISNSKFHQEKTKLTCDQILSVCLSLTSIISGLAKQNGLQFVQDKYPKKLLSQYLLLILHKRKTIQNKNNWTACTSAWYWGGSGFESRQDFSKKLNLNVDKKAPILIHDVNLSPYDEGYNINKYLFGQGHQDNTLAYGVPMELHPK